MSESLRKWLLWGSVVLLVLSIAGMISADLIIAGDSDFLFFASFELTIFSVSNILALIFLRFEKNRFFRRIIIILTAFLPAFLFILLAPASWINVESNLGYSLVIIGLFVSIAAAIVFVFILNKPGAITGLTLILAFVVLTLVLKKFTEGISTEAVAFGFFMLGAGMNMFGIRSLFVIKKNTYLKILTYLVCLLIFLLSWEIIWLTPTRKSTFLIVCSILTFATTFFVLLSLPFSGYILWNDEHKRILKKIIIPWIFVLIIVSARFVFPDLNKLFFSEDKAEYQEFYMEDYQIPDKNGLEPE